MILGTLGIGTTTPSSLLHVLGPSATITAQASGASQSPSLLLQNSTGTNGAGIIYSTSSGEARFGGLSSPAFMTLYSGNTEAMRINASGSVGIGTTLS